MLIKDIQEILDDIKSLEQKCQKIDSNLRVFVNHGNEIDDDDIFVQIEIKEHKNHEDIEIFTINVYQDYRAIQEGYFYQYEHELPRFIKLVQLAHSFISSELDLIQKIMEE